MENNTSFFKFWPHLMAWNEVQKINGHPIYQTEFGEEYKNTNRFVPRTAFFDQICNVNY